LTNFYLFILIKKFSIAQQNNFGNENRNQVTIKNVIEDIRKSIR